MDTPVHITILSLVIGIAASLPVPATDAASRVGIRKTFDDKMGNAHGTVKIYEQGGKFFERLEQGFVPGAGNQ
jgi:hypothetical protein